MSTSYGKCFKAVDGLKVGDGDKVTFDVIEWFHEGWEFGHPTVMLSPVIRIDHDHGADSIIESVCIGLVCGDHLTYLCGSDKQEIEWRGWNFVTLRKRFNQALKGKKFPVANYKAYRVTALFYLDEGELTWKTDVCQTCYGRARVLGPGGSTMLPCLTCVGTGRVAI
jgi:hypothetical protein